jgi:hypothetical protein
VSSTICIYGAGDLSVVGGPVFELLAFLQLVGVEMNEVAAAVAVKKNTK